MPVYEYQCTKCDHNFEMRQGFDADPICDCPSCSSESRRLFKPAPIIFKGSGFYVTDYNGKSPSISSEADESSSKAAPQSKDDSSKTEKSSTTTATKTDD